MAAKPDPDLPADGGHTTHHQYVAGCPDCAAEFDMAAEPDLEPERVVTEVSGPMTPYSRLHDRLVAPTKCGSCGRTDQIPPAAVATAVGLSESGVRRLTQPDAQPSMPMLTKMAGALGVPAARLLAELWPEMGEETPGGRDDS